MALKRGYVIFESGHHIRGEFKNNRKDIVSDNKGEHEGDYNRAGKRI